MWISFLQLGSCRICWLQSSSPLDSPKGSDRVAEGQRDNRPKLSTWKLPSICFWSHLKQPQQLFPATSRSPHSTREARWHSDFGAGWMGVSLVPLSAGFLSKLGPAEVERGHLSNLRTSSHLTCPTDCLPDSQRRLLEPMCGATINVWLCPLA